MSEVKRPFYAGGFLYNPKTNQVLLHKRDNKTEANPNKWGFFGGLNEGTETSLECFQRELFEELNIKIPSDSISYLCDYENVEFRRHRYIYYVTSDLPKSAMSLGEGADFDWISLDKIFSYDLTDKTRRDLEFFIGGQKVLRQQL